MGNRRKALFKFLKEDNDDCKLKDIKNAYGNENVFETPYGEYVVLTDEEADEAHRNNLESLIDDIGLEGVFGFKTWQWDYIVDNFLEDNGIEDYMEEDYQSYYENIKSENDDLFGNRQIKEVIEMLSNNGIISYDLEDIENYLKLKDMSFEDELGSEMLENLTLDTYYSIKKLFEEYDDNENEYIEKCIEIIISEYDNPAEWVVLNFGKDMLKGFIEAGKFTVDIDGISKWIIDNDGRGPSLASWDGEEYEVEYDNIDYYIYRQS